jgi:putative transposase
MVTAPARPELVRWMGTRGLTERRALAVVGMSANSLRYESRPDQNVALRARIVALAQRHRRYGSPMIYLKLRQAGEIINHKRVERLYGLEKLHIKRRRLKNLVIVDDATHEVVAIVTEHTIGGDHLTRILDGICSQRGKPSIIRSDNGPEFTGKAMLTWAHRHGIALRLIEPGKPNQNAYVESLNGRFRDECLNEHWFTSLAHARAVLETWRREYNDERPKKSLEGITPSQYAKQLARKAVTMPENSKPYATEKGVTSASRRTTPRQSSRV